MSHSLARLLANDHPLFTFNLHQLEIAVGGDAVDVKLLGDIMQKAHAVMRDLGIDTADTTAEELYHSLNALVQSGSVEEMLSDTHYVLLEVAGEVISFCVYDVIENAHHNLPFADRKLDHGQRHLRAEIIQRYAAHDRTDHKIVHELAEQAGFHIKEDGDYNYMDDSAHINQQAVATDTQPTILMIGDIFTDAFIELDDSSARVDTDEDGSKRLSLPFGTKPPYKGVEVVNSVGPSPNAAVSTARLGVKTSLMAWLGDDQTAGESLAYLANESIDSTLVSQKSDTKSNYYYVLRLGAERTILVKNESYDYSWIAPEQAPDWVYLSLISDASWQLHEDLVAYLDANPTTKLVFQPGTFHFKWGTEKLKPIYQHAHLVVINREEAVDITGGSYDDVPGLMDMLHELGPKVVVVTDGPNGSYASYDDKKVIIPNYPDPASPLDRTGAGDAFASTITAALALGKSVEEALTWAPVNSASVVQQLGAQAGLLRQDELNEWLSRAPEDYHTRDL